MEVGSSVVLKERWMRSFCFVTRRLIGSGSFLGLELVRAGGADGAVPADDALFENADADADVDERARATISRSTMLTAGGVLERGARQMGQRGFAEIRER